MPISRLQKSDAVDQWLKQSLAERYSATLQEPVPDALLRLFDEAK